MITAPAALPFRWPAEQLPVGGNIADHSRSRNGSVNPLLKDRSPCLRRCLPACGADAVRETDTHVHTVSLTSFVYFLAYSRLPLSPLHDQGRARFASFSIWAPLVSIYFCCTSTPYFTSCTRAFGPASCAKWARFHSRNRFGLTVHAGMG